MATPAGKRTTPVPPDKGSFPLDHEGVCKEYMKTFMKCILEKKENSKCRVETKEYMQCRMDNNLMTKEDWKYLGLADVEINKSGNLR